LERIRKNEGGTSRVYAQGAGKINKTNALELAVLGKAKKFIKSDACQKVITAIYDGRITYSSSSFFDLLPGEQSELFSLIINVKVTETDTLRRRRSMEDERHLAVQRSHGSSARSLPSASS
jgi:hypothetical protein